MDMTQNDLQSLRPVERRILAMREEGVSIEEIGRRLRRSPEHIERIIDWTDIPRSGRSRSDSISPLARRVLELTAQGEDHETIGRRFNRSERYIRQVEGLAHYQKGLQLLSSAASDARSQAGG